MTGRTKKEVALLEEAQQATTKAEFLDKSRIYVILAAKVRKADASFHHMEPGRMMAQVAHVVSRLKMQNIFDAAEVEKGDTPNYEEVWQWVNAYLKAGVTTINLLARDEKELSHVSSLADAAGLTWAEFRDDNDDVYGKGACPKTAIAIGPTTKEEISGICDYLPLYI
jgi:peptidyl-tRNA hydrolase